MRQLSILAIVLLGFGNVRGAEDWADYCANRARLATFLIKERGSKKNEVASVKNSLSCDIKFLRIWASGQLDRLQVPSELIHAYLESEYSNNEWEIQQSICQILEKLPSEPRTKLESARLLFSKTANISSTALQQLSDAPKDLLRKFDETKNTDYKRAFIAQNQILRWVEDKLCQSEGEIVLESPIDVFEHAMWGRKNIGFDEINAAQSMEIYIGLFLKCNKDKHAVIMILTQLFDFSELSTEPALKDHCARMNELQGEFWRLKGQEFGKVLVPWILENRTYIYFHGAQKQFKIDNAAREKRISSKEYRSENKWGSKEGPNKIDPLKVVDENPE